MQQKTANEENFFGKMHKKCRKKVKMNAKNSKIKFFRFKPDLQISSIVIILFIYYLKRCSFFSVEFSEFSEYLSTAFEYFQLPSIIVPIEFLWYLFE